MDEIEQLLEGGKAEAAARRAGHGGSPVDGDRNGFIEEGKSERQRDAVSPSARSHSSSHRSHRRRRDRSRTPRGDRARSRSRDSRRDSRDRDSRRSSRRTRDDLDDDHRSAHSSSSKRHRDREPRDSERDDRKRARRSSRSRSRSRSREDSYGDGRRSSHRSSRRDDSRERLRDRDRDRRRDDRRDDRRDERRSYARDSPRDNRGGDSRRGREPSPDTPKMTEEDHEARSVFVTQLAARIGDRELFQFFEQNVGKVRDARVILDRVSRRSKGVAYVEFMDIEDVRKAINLTGTKLLGLPIVVQYTEAERNRQAGLVQRQNVPDHITIPPGSDARGDAPVPWNRIYVGSLPFSLREGDIRQIFEPFGQIDSVDLHFDNITQKSKGYCFVQYRKLADAQQALDRMNGFDIAGRPIRVGLVTEKGSTSTNNASAGTQATTMRQGGGMMRPDSLEESGSLNNISRIELMQKLARTENTNTLAAPTRPMFRVNVPTATSKSVMLKNMFNPADETEKDWDLELRDDIKSECEEKYGKITEIYVEKDSQGEVYLRFDSLDGAAKALQGLNGRFFGGQQITAQYISDPLFDAHRK